MGDLLSSPGPGAQEVVRECKMCRFQRTDCGGRGNPAPTLTVSAYGAFGTIRRLFVFVKVGARSPRPHLVGVFSDRLIGRIRGLAGSEAFGLKR